MAMSSEIVVTGSRVSRGALQEDLGDLKLYRVPEPVTVASNSQKQVALLDQGSVKVNMVYRHYLQAAVPGEPQPAVRVLTTRNVRSDGLGLPLPAGRVVLFGTTRERPILLGEGFVDDKAVGEEVEIEVGRATSISTSAAILKGEPQGDRDLEFTVSNDHDVPVQYEAVIEEGGVKVSSSSKLTRRDGKPVWAVTIPANGTATLRYRVAVQR
jgi:hypothetical protein